MTHLAMFAAPAASLLRSLAESIVEIELRCGGLEEPADAALHGIYVDPVYY